MTSRCTLTNGAALLLLAGVLAGCGGEHLPRAEDFEGPGVDPERYRAEIVTVDGVLYQDGPLSELGRTRAADALATMGRRIPAEESRPVAAWVLGAELRRLSSTVRHTDLDLPVEETPIRRQWAQVRGSFFADAAWFRWSPRDSLATMAPLPLPPSALRKPTAEERLLADRIITKAELLLEDADRRLDLMDQPDSLPERAEWARHWQGELDDLFGTLNQEPVGHLDMFYRAFFRDARAGLAPLNQLHAIRAANARELRERRLAEARRHLTDARADLAKVAS